MFKEKYKETYNQIEASESLKKETLERMIKASGQQSSTNTQPAGYQEEEKVTTESKRVFIIRQAAYIATCVAMIGAIIFSFQLIPPIGELTIISSDSGHNDFIWEGLYGEISKEFRNNLLDTDDIGIVSQEAENRKEDDNDKSSRPKKGNSKKSGLITVPMRPSGKSSSEEWGDCNKRYWEALRKFSYRSASSVLTESSNEKNRVYSPTSTYMSLSMLAECADGDTKEQILKAMMLTRPGLLQTEPKKVVDALYFSNAHGGLRLGNSVWLNGENKYNEELLKKQAQSCYTEAHYETFGRKKSTSKINQWISSSTSGGIGDFISSLDGSSSMALFNTIDFKDIWLLGFNKNNTKKEPFYLKNDSTMECKFMNAFMPQSYFETSYYRASSMSMRSGKRIVWVLPEEGYTANDILSNPSLLKEAVEKSNTKKKKEVQFKIPLFNIRSQTNLHSSLKYLGVQDAFDDEKANFSPLSEFPLHVSGIEQAACISIREKGQRTAEAIETIKEDEPEVSEEDVDSEEVEEIEEIQDDSEDIQEEEEYGEKMILDKPFVFIVAEGDMPVMVGVVKDPRE